MNNQFCIKMKPWFLQFGISFMSNFNLLMSLFGGKKKNFSVTS